MLTTIEAEVDVNVRLLEPLSLKRPSRAIVTIFEENGNGDASEVNGQNVLEFLRSNRLPENSRPNVEEIEAQIQDARESWG